jgi:hypothetical protein
MRKKITTGPTNYGRRALFGSEGDNPQNQPFFLSLLQGFG